MSRMRRSAIAAALTGLVLTGCSGSGDPEVESTFTPSTTSRSSSAAPTAEPTEPALGPEETVRAWVDAWNQLLANGRREAIDELNATECPTCTDLLDPIFGVYRQGGSIQTDGWSVVSARLKSESKSSSTVIAGVRYSSGVTFEREGAPGQPFAEESHLMTFRLAREDGSWRVGRIAYLS